MAGPYPIWSPCCGSNSSSIGTCSPGSISLSKRLSFPRRREYTLQGFGIAVRTDWIPAFAGMTAPWTADDWQMKTVHEEENPHSPAQVTPPLPLPFYCRGQFYGLQKVLPLA